MSAYVLPEIGVGRVLISVIRSEGKGCASTIEEWADFHIGYWNSEYTVLQGRKKVLLSGLNAYEALFYEYGRYVVVYLYFMAGENAYRLSASAEMAFDDSQILAVPFLESILYSFDPGSASAIRC